MTRVNKFWNLIRLPHQSYEILFCVVSNPWCPKYADTYLVGVWKTAEFNIARSKRFVKFQIQSSSYLHLHMPKQILRNTHIISLCWCLRDSISALGRCLRGETGVQWSCRRSWERLDEREVLRWSRYAAGAQPSLRPAVDGEIVNN